MPKIKRAFFLLAGLALFSCATPPGVKEGEAGGPGRESSRMNRLIIVAAGDNLYHNAMIRAGEEGDYEAAYSEIKPLTAQADIAFINQETLLAGEDFGFSGYPKFNTPQKLGRAIAAAGFDAVNHATNHIMDKGEKAVAATLDFWTNFPQIAVLGIHRSEEERRLPKLIKRNNITVGFLSYTYGTNGLPVPKDKPYLVSLIDEETMAKEIAALRPLCDVLAVSMHWGEEYRHEPSERQRALAAFLAERNVDLILGHHPHVIQRVERLPRPDGKSALCFYSLGNLISAQTRPPTLLGALAFIGIEKKDGEIVFTDSGAIPTVTHFEENFSNFKIYPLDTYTEALAEKHWQNRQTNEFTIKYLSGLSAKVFGEKKTALSDLVSALTPGPDSSR